MILIEIRKKVCNGLLLEFSFIKYYNSILTYIMCYNLYGNTTFIIY